MKNLRITVNGTSYDVQVEEIGAGAAPVASAPAPVAAAPVAPAAPAPAASAGSGEPVKAPMPGVVLDIKVSAGQAVKKGDCLIILEAMKMENEIFCPKDGTVESIVASKGQNVDSGATLLTIK
ncbi:MAG: biotin/lipoyl-containing protein [Acutalibacteraceae bacterium]|nr:biotin/lipoyl-containing protein [Acutalibacteraceae bacterium]